MTLEFLKLTDLYAIPVLFIAGSIFHFIYKWSKYNNWVLVFGAINESIWEHMKIAFWPMLIWAMIQYVIFRDVLPSNFVLAKATSLLLITLTIPGLVYAYTRILRKFIFPIDLSLFLITIALSQFASVYMMENSWDHLIEHLALIPIFILVIIYATFTLNPPKFNLFQDPTNKKFGKDATNKTNKRAGFVTPID